jgi:hypothetical protein
MDPNSAAVEEMKRHLMGEWNQTAELPLDLLSRLQLMTHTFYQGKDAKPVPQV